MFVYSVVVKVNERYPCDPDYEMIGLCALRYEATSVFVSPIKNCVCSILK